MFWFILFIILLVVIFVVMKAISNKKSSTARIAPVSPVFEKRYTWRYGKMTEADNVFDAWTSGDFKAMLAQLNTDTNMIDRHYLLMSIISHAYRNRDDKEKRTICHQVAQMHIKEFPKIKAALEKDFEGLPGLEGRCPHVPTFQQYATILTEEERFSEAIAVCESAIHFGLSDGTKGGFQGRIERIKKKEIKLKKLKNSELGA